MRQVDKEMIFAQAVTMKPYIMHLGATEEQSEDIISKCVEVAFRKVKFDHQRGEEKISLAKAWLKAAFRFAWMGHKALFANKNLRLDMPDLDTMRTGYHDSKTLSENIPDRSRGPEELAIAGDISFRVRNVLAKLPKWQSDIIRGRLQSRAHIPTQKHQGEYRKGSWRVSRAYQLHKSMFKPMSPMERNFASWAMMDFRKKWRELYGEEL